MQTVVNKTFDEIAPGDAASVERTLQAGDMRAWGAAFGEGDMLAGPSESQAAAGIVTAMLTALAGSALPGPGSTIRAISVQIKGSLPIATAMTARLIVRERRPDQGIVVLDGQCTDSSGRVVATAILEVVAPTTRQQYEIAEHRLEGLIERCRSLKPMLTGVVHPCSADALSGAVEAAEAGLILPVLYGPEDEIGRIADHAGLNIAKYRIVGAEGSEDSALKAAMAAGAGEIAALMKGSLHTDVFLHAVMQKEAKLRTGRLISHCTMVSVPSYARRFVVSCAQYRTGHRSEARYMPERDRLRACARHRPAESGRAGGSGNGADQHAGHPSRRDPGEDGGPPADRRRHRRRAARPRCRGRCGGRADQAYLVAGRGYRRCPHRAEHRGRQHGLQESRLHGRCADRWPRGRRAGPHDPDQ